MEISYNPFDNFNSSQNEKMGKERAGGWFILFLDHDVLAS